MANPTETEIKELEDFLSEFSGDLLETSRELINEKYTAFPIFIVHKEPLELGQIILDRIDLEQPYNISASTLEEFQDVGFIQDDKINSFKAAYGNPLKQMCILWIINEEAHYVFVPFASHVEDKNQ